MQLLYLKATRIISVLCIICIRKYILESIKEARHDDTAAGVIPADVSRPIYADACFFLR